MSQQVARAVAALWLCIASAAHADPAADAKVRTDTGKRMLRERKFTDAITVLLDAQRIEPRPERLYYLALAYQLSGDRTKALEQYRAVLAAEPKGKYAAECQRTIKILETELAAADVEAKKRAELDAAYARSAQRIEEAKARVDAANAKIATLEQQLAARTAERDAAAAAADAGKRAADDMTARAEAWRKNALAAPSGGGRGRRIVGTWLVAAGGALLGAGAWYGLDASEISDALSTRQDWSTTDDALVLRGEQGDDRVKLMVPLGGGVIAIGAVVLGLGEAAIRKPAETSASEAP